MPDTITDDQSNNTNEVQTVTITGSPTGGVVTVTFRGQTTTDIAVTDEHEIDLMDTSLRNAIIDFAKDELRRRIIMPSTTYDVLPFSDGNGKVYMGNLRAASYHWEGPGHTAITLEGRDSSGRRFAHSGTCNQIDLAESTCVIWATEGRISENFQKVE